MFYTSQTSHALRLLFVGLVLVSEMKLTHPPPIQRLFSCISVSEGYPHVLINVFFLCNTEIIIQ